ncbi:hypothetical protein K5D56_26085 [Pseudomonas cichorii]|nr:hypothetical protein [Pseudomonas cichorii]MBX8557037.1 hypothetical protein [Pseudomonas cichorii]MBX8592848.1 hypothetical protein [Pseudomonas cichorii]
MDTTASQYAKQQGISITTARKKLNAMVEIGRAKVSYQVIIEHRTMKRGSRSQMVPVRGSLYHLA